MDEFSGTDCRRWIKLSCLKTAYKILKVKVSAADILILGSDGIRLERNKITFCFEKVRYNIANIMYNSVTNHEMVVCSKQQTTVALNCRYCYSSQICKNFFKKYLFFHLTT